MILSLLVHCGVSWWAVSCYISKLPMTLIRNYQIVCLQWLSPHSPAECAASLKHIFYGLSLRHSYLKQKNIRM